MHLRGFGITATIYRKSTEIPNILNLPIELKQL